MRDQREKQRPLTTTDAASRVPTDTLECRTTRLSKVIPFIGGRPMDSLPQPRLLQSRRDIMKSGAWAVVPLAIPFRNLALQDHQQPMTANCGADPYPIPWLDKNGGHHEPAGPNLEFGNSLLFTLASGKYTRLSQFHVVSER
jgi:hypothetical protein